MVTLRFHAQQPISPVTMSSSRSQNTPTTRRPILRFELTSISIDGKPNAYKKPRLVLKPQLELAPRRPYTGSRPRVPVWRCFLMVHVKDKADELVKLDLDSFKPSPADGNSTIRYSIACSLPDCSLLFQYPGSTESVPATLSITVQNASDFETIMQELSNLGIHAEDEQGSQEQGSLSRPATLRPWAPAGQTLRPTYTPSGNIRPFENTSPHLGTGPTLQAQYPSYPERHLYSSLQRPPSHPLEPPTNIQAGQRPWSPAFVPSRPATTLGVPGILGEGIYKLSKIGSTSSGRPRVRRTTTPIEQQGHRLYTVSKHFDKTLSRADILHATRGRYLGRGLSSSFQGESSSYPTRSPSLGNSRTADQGISGQDQKAWQYPARMSSVLERVPVNTQHQPRLRRLRTASHALDISPSTGFNDNEENSLLSNITEEKNRHPLSYSQPKPASKGTDDIFHFSSSPTIFEQPTEDEVRDDWLIQSSQIQHQGLCEASKVWDEFMDKAGKAMAAAEPSRDLSDVLSRFEDEFTRRWEGVVAATAQNMRRF
ncbi:hypothetical protein B0I37DRAFT_408020 [Chaetomium sp. MPI-CAGE-AT-0009]|nr:hypothetical protein B0I37DRAFT_408020 [Chaetomium sp. MPI-CAGE-AT-0009]